jgi:hypothetical protein
VEKSGIKVWKSAKNVVTLWHKERDSNEYNDLPVKADARDYETKL